MKNRLDDELKLECPEEKQPRTFTYVGEEGVPWASKRVYMCNGCNYILVIKPKQEEHENN